MTFNYPTEKQIDSWYDSLNDFLHFGSLVYIQAFLEVINEYEPLETDIL